MKIVHLTTHINGGAGNFAANVFKAGLKINNHQNYLFSLDSLKLNFFFSLYSSLLNRVYDKIYFLASSFKIDFSKLALKASTVTSWGISEISFVTRVSLGS